MLSKELCKRCIDERYANIGRTWDEDDEINWESGFVICVRGYGGGPPQMIKEAPTKWCNFFFEQMVLSQKLVLSQGPSSC